MRHAVMLVNSDHNRAIVAWMNNFQQELHDILGACLTRHLKHEAAIGFFYVHFYFEMARRNLPLHWTHNPLCEGQGDASQCVLTRNFSKWYKGYGLLDMPEQIFKDFLNEVTVELTHATYMEESVHPDGGCPELHFTLRPSGERVVLRQHIPHTFTIHDQLNDLLSYGASDIVIKLPFDYHGRTACRSIVAAAVKRQSICGRLSIAVVGYTNMHGGLEGSEDLIQAVGAGKWVVYIQFSWPGPRQRFYAFSRWHNPHTREFDDLEWKANQIRYVNCT